MENGFVAAVIVKEFPEVATAVVLLNYLIPNYL